MSQVLTMLSTTYLFASGDFKLQAISFLCLISAMMLRVNK